MQYYVLNIYSAAAAIAIYKWISLVRRTTESTTHLFVHLYRYIYAGIGKNSNGVDKEYVYVYV